jgi:hypothetical protein
MEKKYRIQISRRDEAPRVYEEPSFNGESIEECDKKAKERLEFLANAEGHSWENFWLSRIDVVEVTTRLVVNNAKGKEREVIIY